VGKAGAAMKRIIPIGFIGKDILAVEKEIKPVIEDAKAYREELARDFRQAVDLLRSGLLNQEGEDYERAASTGTERAQQESEITR
jgi:hypothetical protein